MKSDLKVIYEDNHLLVVDKPALLPTMGVREGEHSLLLEAKNYLREKYNKPGNVFLGVVSRLDSFVSGVVVFARTSKAASRLTEQFRSRSVEKKYLAIIPDSDSLADSGRLEDRLVKNEQQHRMVVLKPGSQSLPNEKIAILEYDTVGRNQGQRLVFVRLETGRKHQIRVQFAARGTPIIGDRKYDSEIPFKKGIALHSFRLSLIHPTQKSPQSFQSEPPAFWRIARFGYDRNWNEKPPR